MNIIKDVFFDLDRTLWDFERNSENALRVIYDEAKIGNHAASFEHFLETYKVINARYWKNYSEGKIDKLSLRNGRFTDTLKEFKIVNEKLGGQLNNRYLEISPFQTQLFPSTKEVLTELKNNNYRLHIITNGFKEVQFIKLKNSGIIEFFEDILCSEEVGKSKPHPLVFECALKRTKAKAKHSIMIGDDFTADVIGAENVGIRGVLFDPERKHKSKMNVDRVEHLEEIPPLILGI
ncbi:YjjG family noncanonical pyrimidine nucleotidase [Brumimicrobium aurantiacum]|uniref:Noncanonical pyrimidine nucleotidase, YjjG family n=1 Tax=Brumimicrobium aurantiacum TaxID=1737063 RepID=A0A3E1EVZ6_9FLAO|nr:YjjG family noncanonical pyrimidine nucleotidase [Brumimicrobium aurantiacum]RFC53734.1 noncanonical pyrimidine nucleotidase, YjjG family [Brumimicrobium aurantiacum]